MSHAHASTYGAVDEVVPAPEGFPIRHRPVLAPLRLHRLVRHEVPERDPRLDKQGDLKNTKRGAAGLDRFRSFPWRCELVHSPAAPTWAFSSGAHADSITRHLTDSGIDHDGQARWHHKACNR